MKDFVAANKWWAYFILTYLISWSIWTIGGAIFPEGLDVIPLLIGAFGPFTAALILYRIDKGKSSLKDWLRRIFKLKIGVNLYLLGAIVLPFGTAGIHHGIYLLFGGESGVNISAEWLTYFAYLIPTALLSGGNEEPGWRGYITPVLIRKFDILTANLFVGVGWALWHMPLYFIGIWGSDDQSALWLFMYCFPLSMIMTWLFYYSKQSVIPVMLFHAGSNVVFRYFPMETQVMDNFQDEFTVIKTMVYWFIAIILLVSTKGTLGYKAMG